MSFNLFPEEQIIGLFNGLRDGGLEFHADLVISYRKEFQRIPMHGQFILIQLETTREAMLGRIVSLCSDGKFSSKESEDMILRALREKREVPEQLREEGLKYRVSIQVLGILRYCHNGRLAFVASHRRLPHLGSLVAFPSAKVLQEISGHNIQGVTIGHFALGEYIYAKGSQEMKVEDWMHVVSPEVCVRFSVKSLISRRSFIFARAGFGKSNLNKLLFSELYKTTPTILKRGQREVPVGTIIFDPDGEYFWPDDQGRPGLCDIPELEDKLVVFTSRKGPSEFYQSFVASGIKIDVSRLSPSDVLSIALGAHKQDQQNVRKLKDLDAYSWRDLVHLIAESGNTAPLEEVCDILHLEKKQEAEALAARANMTAVLHSFHENGSSFLDILFAALTQGKLCIIDMSQMRDATSLILSALILRLIFDRNQAAYTRSQSDAIPTIAVIEEAQAILTEKSSAAQPYLSWIKEGRKYGLGALLITQQPGSIPTEILSQGDNWFVLHLLSAIDLKNLQRANAYFSQDILSMLLNEPLAGHCTLWSSVGGKPYPIPLRIVSFEQKYSLRDPYYNRPSVFTYARSIRAQMKQRVDAA